MLIVIVGGVEDVEKAKEEQARAQAGGLNTGNVALCLLDLFPSIDYQFPLQEHTHAKITTHNPVKM